MITNSKLANQPDNKLTKKFRPVDMGVDYVEITPNKKPRETRGKKNKRKWLFVLMPILLLVVAGVTFGVIWGVYSANRSRGTEVATEGDEVENVENTEETDGASNVAAETNESVDVDEATASIQPITSINSANPTIKFGRLMLINPNFTVEPEFIAARKSELISLKSTYGIIEMNAGNGDNLLDPEAATHLNEMLSEYTMANPGHSIQTVSCFREVGTNCGRLCAATGASDHHTGLTCDLIDPVYGTSLDTDDYEKHIEWQWLKENSYKYGFIDRFPEAWAGGPMSEPANVDETGTTGLYETWHYRYVGPYTAREIATGVYNNGKYDSLEHYLLMRGLVPDLLNQ
ncbi:MAG: D-alanyl-D-alanine carboxypeptidase family protein [Candidatus Saccharibacteria bacterium]|nr:D-alanyl-D-alanine carboxypeptidase family protein [Candidatus Saccharibacteria bacterium]